MEAVMPFTLQPTPRWVSESSGRSACFNSSNSSPELNPPPTWSCERCDMLSRHRKARRESGLIFQIFSAANIRTLERYFADPADESLDFGIRVLAAQSNSQAARAARHRRGTDRQTQGSMLKQPVSRAQCG